MILQRLLEKSDLQEGQRLEECYSCCSCSGSFGGGGNEEMSQSKKKANKKEYKKNNVIVMTSESKEKLITLLKAVSKINQVNKKEARPNS